MTVCLSCGAGAGDCENATETPEVPTSNASAEAPRSAFIVICCSLPLPPSLTDGGATDGYCRHSWIMTDRQPMTIPAHRLVFSGAEATVSSWFLIVLRLLTSACSSAWFWEKLNSSDQRIEVADAAQKASRKTARRPRRRSNSDRSATTRAQILDATISALNEFGCDASKTTRAPTFGNTGRPTRRLQREDNRR